MEKKKVIEVERWLSMTKSDCEINSFLSIRDFGLKEFW